MFSIHSMIIYPTKSAYYIGSQNEYVSDAILEINRFSVDGHTHRSTQKCDFSILHEVLSHFKPFLRVTKSFRRNFFFIYLLQLEILCSNLKRKKIRNVKSVFSQKHRQDKRIKITPFQKKTNQLNLSVRLLKMSNFANAPQTKWVCGQIRPLNIESSLSIT